MNKISVLAISAIIAMPVFAEEVTHTTKSSVTEGIENIELYDEPIADNLGKDFSAKKESNPKVKFPRGMQIGAGVSATSGLNGFIGYANKDFESFWWKRLGVRFDFATTSPVKSAINSAVDSALGDGVDIGDELSINSGELAAKHMGLLVDFYPFGNTWFAGGWRLTGGYVKGSMKVSAGLTGEISSLPGEGFEFEFGDNIYRYAGNSLKGTAGLDWKYSGPYLGTGFDLGIFRGFKIYMDAGVVFTSKTASVGIDIPFDGLTVSHDNGKSWESINDADYKDELERIKADTLADANDALNDIKFYPMIKLGFMYRF